MTPRFGGCVGEDALERDSGLASARTVSVVMT